MPGRRFVSPLEFARITDLPQWLVLRAVREGVLPADTFIRCGRTTRLDLEKKEAIVEAIKRWANTRGPQSRPSREERIRRIVGSVR
jgi:predicted type IV restriction endonuclease